MFSMCIGMSVSMTVYWDVFYVSMRKYMLVCFCMHVCQYVCR